MYDKVAMNLWLDTGGEKSYKYARSLYKEIVEPKSEQEIFIYREKVIKFFRSEITCNMLINRHNLLRPYSPVIVRIDKNLISYQFIKGKLLSETKEKIYINKLLNYLDNQAKNALKNGYNFKKFKEDCDQMWFKKLKERILSFDKDMNDLDQITSINGIKIPSVHELIKGIDKYFFLEKCIPCIFHSDQVLKM